MKDPKFVVTFIVKWLKDYVKRSQSCGFVVGVSGGIDSALTSTLCAMTKLPVVVLGMHINQSPDQQSRSNKHIHWLGMRHKNVTGHELDLTNTFNSIQDTVQSFLKDDDFDLAMANTRSRIRAVCLYSFANARNLLVAGTGNKVEDYGIGFFTKYGDGAVDISPIADLTKTEVRECSRLLGIIDEIIEATPTDGLWGDDRSDEDQIGASYEELEWALWAHESQNLAPSAPKTNRGDHIQEYLETAKRTPDITDRQVKVLEIYLNRHYRNAHKLSVPPACIFSEDDKALVD